MSQRNAAHRLLPIIFQALLLLACIAFCFPPPAYAAASDPAWRTAMPNNGQFQPIANTASMNGVTALSNGYVEGGAFNSSANTINIWNGLAASDTEWWSAANGGHGVWQNPVYYIDFRADAPQWVMHDPGSTFDAVVDDGPVYRDGRWVSRHSYYQSHFIKARNRVMHFGIGAAYGTSSPAPYWGGPQVDGFDVGTRMWDPPGTYPNVPPSSHGLVMAAAKHPVTEDVYVAFNGAISQWTQQTNSWNALHPSGSSCLPGQYRPLLVDAKRNRLVSLGDASQTAPYQTRLGFVDLATSHASCLTVGGPLPQTGTWSYSAMVWDEDHDRYVTIQGDRAYAIDPATGGSTDIGSVPPPHNGLQNRLAYFKALGGIAYLPSYSSPILFLPTREANPVPADAIAPTVVLTAPANSATVSGTVTVSAHAYDKAGVAGVQFKLDGNNLGSEDTAAPYAISWDTATAAEGTHVVTAVARDAAGNVAVSASHTVTVSRTGLQFTVSPQSLAAGGTLTTAWVNIPSPTRTDWVGIYRAGAGASAFLDWQYVGGGKTASVAVPSGSLQFKLPASLVDGPHEARLYAADGFALLASAPLAVGAPTDTTPPAVSLTAPANGVTVTGASVVVSANASDDVAVAGVQFMLDGNRLGSEDTIAPYAVTWNTTTVSNGTHTLAAVARDAAGNSTTSAPITVTVNNADTTAPSVSLTAPAHGATVSGQSVIVSASASDNVAVAGVQFQLNGNNLGLEDDNAPYSVSWNTTLHPNGTHYLVAIAHDAAGNSATSAPVTVTVNNVPPDTTSPSVSITAPAGGAVVSGSAVTVSANASDDVGIAGVQFRLDGSNLGTEDTSPPYSVTWNTTAVSNGNHTLTAVARDAAGNATTSASVTVEVNNVAPLTLSAVAASSITSNSAVIKWNSNRAATGVVRYGTSASALTLASAPTAAGTSHSVTVTGLTPKTTYFYQVQASATDGATAASAIESFKTKPK